MEGGVQRIEDRAINLCGKVCMRRLPSCHHLCMKECHSGRCDSCNFCNVDEGTSPLEIVERVSVNVVERTSLSHSSGYFTVEISALVKIIASSIQLNERYKSYLEVHGL